MNQDINFKIDNFRLNIRVGVIISFENKVLIEISKEGENSVVPGGRVKLYEKTIEAIKREILEEMNFPMDETRLFFKRVIENLFETDSNKVHELFFLYQYKITDIEYEMLSTIKDNADNNKTYFEFVPIDKLKEINLLPDVLINIIKENLDI